MTSTLGSTEEHLIGIAQIQLRNLRGRLSERRIDFNLSRQALEHLVRVGYDPSYGARPLKRAIQREIETPLARMLLEGRVRDGQTLHIDKDAGSDGLRFEPGSGVEESA